MLAVCNRKYLEPVGSVPAAVGPLLVLCLRRCLLDVRACTSTSTSGVGIPALLHLLTGEKWSKILFLYFVHFQGDKQVLLHAQGVKIAVTSSLLFVSAHRWTGSGLWGELSGCVNCWDD